MSLSEWRLTEIEAAKMRHAWAKAEYERNPSSLALARFVDDTLKEWRALRVGPKRGSPKISI